MHSERSGDAGETTPDAAASDGDSTHTLASGRREIAIASSMVETAFAPRETSLGLDGAVSDGDSLPTFDGPRYTQGPLLGSGGMGEVSLDLDRSIGRGVAKKTLRADLHGKVPRARFVREARVQGQLEHPAVVPVHDLGIDEDGRLYFTMKRIRGETLAQILTGLGKKDEEVRARFTRHKLLSAFLQVCLAIEYAHRRGVIHRDLKPANIMVGDFGEVYVLDWGLAKLRDTPDLEPELGAVVREDMAPEVTTDGDVLGTPLYMAPEQMMGRHSGLDIRADVFSLGTILFEILTLEPYRRGESIGAIVAGIKTNFVVDRPSQRAPGVPRELDEICVRALAFDKESRLSSAKEMAIAVERYLDGDREALARKAQSEELLRSAKERRAAPDGTRAASVLASTREVIKALALSPEDPEAQKLLISLIVEGSSDLSPEAEEEFREHELSVRLEGARRGVFGYIAWLGSLPLAIWLGIRDWSIAATLVVVTLACATYALVVLKTRAKSRVHTLALAALSSVALGLSSSWLGPFVLTPVAICATCVMFLVHADRRDIPWLLAICGTALLAPFAVESLHLVPAAYSFRDGDIVLHARATRLPEGLTIAVLAYTSVSFVLLLGWFVGRLRDKQRAAERRLLGQASLLRQLFPLAKEPK